jgi:hypothetical protein
MGQDPHRRDRHDPAPDEAAREGAHRAGREEDLDEVVEEDVIPEGSGKQFARGVGNEHVDERLAPAATEVEHGERIPKGSGKQFARGVGEEEEEEPPGNRRP